VAAARLNRLDLYGPWKLKPDERKIKPPEPF